MKEQLILKHNRSLGDIVVMTAALRDLHVSYPDKFETFVKTSCQEVWENNPWVAKGEPSEDAKVLNCEYGDLLKQSRFTPYHFLHGFRKDLEKHLALPIQQGPNKGDIYLSHKEVSEPFLRYEDGRPLKYWIISTGGKFDFTTKWWHPDYAQKVIDHFKEKIKFVQVGAKNHFHPRLVGDNVIDLVGRTSIRDLIRLTYWCDGVLCGITSHMHLAAAVPTVGNKIRPCVVYAGGREPDHWEAYTGHKFLSNIGRLPCCAQGACWKAKATLTSEKHGNVCTNVVDLKRQVRVSTEKKSPKGGTIVSSKVLDMVIPKCMELITPNKVIEAIEEYYDGGALQY